LPQHVGYRRQAERIERDHQRNQAHEPFADAADQARRIGTRARLADEIGKAGTLSQAVEIHRAQQCDDGLLDQRSDDPSGDKNHDKAEYFRDCAKKHCQRARQRCHQCLSPIGNLCLHGHSPVEPMSTSGNRAQDRTGAMRHAASHDEASD